MTIETLNLNALKALQARAAEQAMINNVTADTFDDWVPVRIKQDVFTGLGQAFAAGELTLAPPGDAPDGTRTPWSFRNRIPTKLHPIDMEDVVIENAPASLAA